MSNISELLLNNPDYSKILKKATIVSAELDIPAYLVGGSVRDKLIGKENSKDIDLMVEKNSELFSSELAKKLNVKTLIKFEKFYTYRIPYPDIEIEIAAARKETYNPESRKPNQVILIR